MSKNLDHVIKEMSDYADMGMPDGQGSMGMGTPTPAGKLKDVYKMQQLKTNRMLRHRNRAEEEEGSMGGADDMSAMADVDAMGDEDMSSGMGDMSDVDSMPGDEGMSDIQDDAMGTEDDVAQLQQFFADNPEPSDDDISRYANENGMDMMGMRRGVYALIQSLLPDNTEAASAEFDWLGGDDSSDPREMDGMDDIEGMDDMADTGETSELDFSVPGDTGERPAKKEYEERAFGRRSTDRRTR